MHEQAEFMSTVAALWTVKAEVKVLGNKIIVLMLSWLDIKILMNHYFYPVVTGTMVGGIMYYHWWWKKL